MTDLETVELAARFANLHDHYQGTPVTQRERDLMELAINAHREPDDILAYIEQQEDKPEPVRRWRIEHDVGGPYPRYDEVTLLLHPDGTVTWDPDDEPVFHG